MIATVSYIAATAYGAQITPYALIATAFVDFALAKAFVDWMESRAIAKARFVPVPVAAQAVDADKELSEMALSAEEVEERYEQ